MSMRDTQTTADDDPTMMTHWYPEIMYEEDSKIPFVPVPHDEKMPAVLFIFESRETGEDEPDLEGNPLPIVDLDLYQYANMNMLKNVLEPEIFDCVRQALGLEPVKIAASKGHEVTEKVRDAVEKS